MTRPPATRAHRGAASLHGVAAAVACAVLGMLTASCAGNWQTPPAGGPPDSTAPTVETTSPANGTVNFRDQTISFTFSEYVDEAKAPAAVVITPIPVTPPQFDFSGRTLEITFAEPLVPNRTYAVTVGSAVNDLSGNRLGRPVTLRFATGDHIDSGQIAGKVLGKAKGTAFIFGYMLPAEGTSAAFRPDSIHPDFIAPIGDDGTYTLEGLPVGRFRLLAIVDEYGDRLYSPGQDAYGLAPHDVTVTSQSEPVTGVAFRIRSAPDDLAPPSLYAARSLDAALTELRMSEPLDSAGIRPEGVRITAGGTDVRATRTWRGRGSPLIVIAEHPALPAGAEATVNITGARDTAGNAMPDSTARATFTVLAAPDTAVPELLRFSVDSLRAYAFGDSILVAFDRPVRASAMEDAMVIRDSARARARMRLEQRSPTEFIARPLDTLQGLQRATMEINLGRFTGFGGGHRDSVARIPLAIELPRQSGVLQGTLADSAAPGARHILTVRSVERGAMYRKVMTTGAWEFPALPEGEYEVNAFRDENGDGLYGYGSVIPYTPSEPWGAWTGTIRVRPRWTTNGVALVIR